VIALIDIASIRSGQVCGGRRVRPTYAIFAR
jgi:hypothetical protein